MVAAIVPPPAWAQKFRALPPVDKPMIYNSVRCWRVYPNQLRPVKEIIKGLRKRQCLKLIPDGLIEKAAEVAQEDNNLLSAIKGFLNVALNNYAVVVERGNATARKRFYTELAEVFAIFLYNENELFYEATTTIKGTRALPSFC